jgi:hypothetical protein
VDAAHELVPIRLTLRQEAEQNERKHALEELGVMTTHLNLVFTDMYLVMSSSGRRRYAVAPVEPSRAPTTPQQMKARANVRQNQTMVFYGLAELELGEVVEFFSSLNDAEAALRAVLHDEPEWAAILAVARLEYKDGTFEVDLDHTAHVRGPSRAGFTH